MISQLFLNQFKTNYSTVYIIDDRDYWEVCKKNVNKKKDLILTIDFALSKMMVEMGYSTWVLDSLADSDFLQEKNIEMHFFLDNWHTKAFSEHKLNYSGINIGEVIKLYILDDTTLFCQFFFNLICLKSIKFEKLILCSSYNIICDILNKLNIPFYSNKNEVINQHNSYIFPISKWIDSRTKNITIKKKIGIYLKNVFDIFNEVIYQHKGKKVIYIQDYYPTKSIVEKLICENDYIVMLPDYRIGFSIFRHIRIVPFTTNWRPKLLDCIALNSEDDIIPWISLDHELHKYLMPYINKVLLNKIGEVRILIDKIINRLEKYELVLSVPVTDYWPENNIVIQYSRAKSIPVFMIANGLLLLPHENDGKKADYINCYSEIIRKEYLNGADNGVVLGDPRMDQYANRIAKKINRKDPTITIGAAGYNNIDLNSNLSFEFDFLFDILKSIKYLIKNGYSLKVILKLRTNSYNSTYKNFCKEYFPEINMVVETNKLFSEVLISTDLYISFYSQTLFEASVLGIPTIYYKKDRQFLNSPFNNDCELCTASNLSQLKELLIKFYDNDDIYNNFMDKSVLCKYIGPLDGKNHNRNIDFIKKLTDYN